MQESVENKLNSIVGHSGNSDVDLTVNLQIDTKVIAYGMLCSSYAKGELSDAELEKGIKKLDELIERDKKKKEHKKKTTVESTPRLFNPWIHYKKK